jgi:hypothetical protein
MSFGAHIIIIIIIHDLLKATVKDCSFLPPPSKKLRGIGPRMDNVNTRYMRLYSWMLFHCVHEVYISNENEVVAVDLCTPVGIHIWRFFAISAARSD